MKPSSTIVALMLLLLLVASPPLPYCDANLECDKVVEHLMTCIAYLKGGGSSDTPPTTCCDGVEAVLNSIKSVDDKRDACNCFKVIGQITKAKPENAKDLPIKCRIRLPFQISPAFDCSSIG